MSPNYADTVTLATEKRPSRRHFFIVKHNFDPLLADACHAFAPKKETLFTGLTIDTVEVASFF